jgi:DNA-binding CsgD family transcriptional regulator
MNRICASSSMPLSPSRANAGRRHNERHDLIAIVEAAYESESDDATWLRKVALAAKPAFDRGEGMLATFVQPNYEKLRTHSVLLGCDEAHYRFAIEAGRFKASQDVARIYSSNRTLTTSRENIGVKPGQPMPDGVRELAAECRFVDAAVLLVADPTGFGFLFGASFRDDWAPTRRERGRWSKIAAHLAAGYRLQRRLSSPSPPDLAIDEAILDPNGTVQHAEGAARDPHTRSWLRETARRIDKARTSLRRDDPDAALAFWQGLVSGRWSLVDRFDSDGRRYLIARKNDPEVAAAMTLTSRETQVVKYAALGHPNKLVAYELGLSESSVSECMKRARAKLGVGSRAELVQLLRLGGVSGAPR